MTIDKKQLISLLEEKTGLEREQVENQLSELVSRIQNAAEEGKTFEVEGFGTFSMEEGELQFEPEDVLETEINNKYAGMKPIELIGAFKEPERDEEVPKVDMSDPDAGDMDTDKWAFDSDATQEKKDSTTPETSESDKEPEDKATKETEQKEIEEESQETDEALDKVLETAEEEAEETETPKEPEPKEPVEAMEQEEKKDPIGTILVAVVVVIAVGIGGWMIYDFGFTGTSSSEVSTTYPQSTETVAPADDAPQSEEQNDQQSGEEEMEPEEPSSVSTGEEGTGTEPVTQQQDRYGLMGEPNQAISNGYTIVVHSLRDQQQAEQNRKQLQEAGYRALINQAEVEGTTYYRVGIGQFETISDAQQAIADIPKRYQDNNFIKRI